MIKNSKIYIAGHRGLVGSAIYDCLLENGYTNIVTKSSGELDLRCKEKVDEFFASEQIDYVFLAAAKVGGIIANDQYPADFIRDNLMIQTNVIDAAYRNKIKKLLFLGSTCIYPKMAPQPLKEEYLLTGELEKTNEAYAIAKIAGIKMCEFYNKQYGTNYISVMPTNLYGKNDNFSLQESHVLPGLIRKFHDAKMENAGFVKIWGTGKPRREFLYATDLADACIHLMHVYDDSTIVNIGVGKDIEIIELAKLIKEVVGFKGEILLDSEKPDGTPRKLVDVTKINGLGWKAQTSLEEGVQKVYNWFLENKDSSNIKM